MKKRLILILISAFIFSIIITSFPINAENNQYINVYLDYYDYYDNYSDEIWDGKSKFKPNTVYFIEGKVTISTTLQLPLDSMIVVKNGAQITIKDKGALYIKGRLGVEYGGALNLESGSKLVINSGSIFGVNGSVVVGTEAEIKIYSKMFIYGNALVSINGTVSTFNGGFLFYVDDFKLYNKGKFNGMKQRINGMDKSLISVGIPDVDVYSLRFYDRVNSITYRITHSGVNEAIVNSLGKIKLFPLYETHPAYGKVENNFSVKLYNSKGNLFFSFDKPYEENQIVYMNGYAYAFTDSAMTFDEFYFYALGVRSNFKRG